MLTEQEKEELNSFFLSKERTGKEVLRAQTIIFLDKGVNIEEITKITGFKRSQIFELRKKYLNNGVETIKDKQKGKPKELLTKKQREELTDILKSQTPKDFKYGSDYWTTGILGEYILRRYKVKYKSKTSIYLIFREAKFTYHKPGRVYEKRDDQEVLNWKKSIKSKIKKAFQDLNTVILCEDEMVLSTQTTFQKIWLPQGEYPKIEISNKKENRSIYGFLNIKTGKEHSFKTKWQNMHITKEILTKIRKIYPKQKILLLWDGAGWHRGSVVQEFIKEDENIETIYFPRYSPEENPQEHVWKNGRDKITHNKFIENIDNATDEFINYLNTTRFNYSLLGFFSPSS